ncbi:MAG: hypothetical protein EP335_16745 [Alphaproteobacteria bacterium]|nr:MAG: hypothetical protein EP335_16745 [Alphaproteobacteria bacterium]
MVFMFRIAAVLVAVLLLAPAGRAEHFRIAIASEDDLYIGEILRLALEKLDEGHSSEVIRGPEIAQSRALRSLGTGRAHFDVIYSAYTLERDKRLTMVNFPLTRGMLGYRVLAVRADRAGAFDPAMSFEKLQSGICFGSGMDWPDTDVLKRAGLCVVTAHDENLWPMLARGRFDAYPRGLIEVLSELGRESGRHEKVGLALDPSIMLAYRQDLFFFLPKRDKARAAIILRGLEAMHADGSYDRFLYNVPAIRDALREVQGHQRTTFHLSNKPDGAALATISEEHWYHFDDAAAVAGLMELSASQHQ